MSRPNQPQPTPDDSLADFTDRVLAGESLPASAEDVELRGLEETVLRLKQSLPQQALDERVLKRLQANFKVRVRKATSSDSSIWQSLRLRQRLTLAFVGVALAAILIAVPFLPVPNGSIEGTAGLQPREILLLGGILCVTILLIWVRRQR